MAGGISIRNSKTNVRIAILAVLLLTSVATRLLPLSLSPYPFNNDSITECVAASAIIENEGINIATGFPLSDSHSMVTPVYNVFLGFVSLFVGVDPYWIAQITVSMISALTIIGIYLIANQITGNAKGSIACALVLSFYGTFVFMTGSAWKESIGVSILVLLVYAYMNRDDRRMLALEISTLAVLPLVHHLAAAIAYLALAYITVWSLAFAILARDLKRRHIVDLFVVGILSLVTYVYYYLGSFERVSYFSDGIGAMTLVFTFSALSFLLIFFLRRRGSTRLTFAPVPAVVIFSLFTWDYFFPLFSYTQGAPKYVFILTGTTCVLILLAWYGYERLRASNSLYRAVPVCILLPILTLFVFGLVARSGISGHQVIYRSFDFAYISLALGTAITVSNLKIRPRLQTLAVAALTVSLILSFPFAYVTGPLEGVRHDTQEYEVDSMDWVLSRVGTGVSLRSDERLSYLASAIHGLGRDPYLALNLSEEILPAYVSFNLLLEEWSSIGVNAYPHGRVFIDESLFVNLLQASNVLYIGGPSSNNAFVFRLSSFGEDVIGL